jgi:hypothetical protein
MLRVCKVREMRNAEAGLSIIGRSLESHVIRKRSCVGSERGRWKSTLMGNSSAAYSSLMRSSEGGREKSTH